MCFHVYSLLNDRHKGREPHNNGREKESIHSQNNLFFELNPPCLCMQDLQDILVLQQKSFRKSKKQLLLRAAPLCSCSAAAFCCGCSAAVAAVGCQAATPSVAGCTSCSAAAAYPGQDNSLQHHSALARARTRPRHWHQPTNNCPCLPARQDLSNQARPGQDSVAASFSIVRMLIHSSDEDLRQIGHIHPDCPCP